MYLNGMGFRGIERVTGVHHTTIINWVKQVGKLLLDAYNPEVIPEAGELDELQTFVGSKKAARPRAAETKAHSSPHVANKGALPHVMLAKTTKYGYGQQ